MPSSAGKKSGVEPGIAHVAPKRVGLVNNNFGSKAARRDFLRSTATGALLAVAALAVGAPKEASAKPETKNERKRLRYKETDHVERYYESNRY
jgi:hypothetical protein